MIDEEKLKKVFRKILKDDELVSIPSMPGVTFKRSELDAMGIEVDGPQTYQGIHKADIPMSDEDLVKHLNEFERGDGTIETTLEKGKIVNKKKKPDVEVSYRGAFG